MTATVVLDYIETAKSVCLDTQIKITACASNLNGTSAELLTGDMLTVEELLYGMMLPSGNDAAQSLALYFGVLFQFDGDVEPNTYLSIVDSKEIEESILRVKQEKYKDKILLVETPEEKKFRFYERYDIMQNQKYYEEVKENNCQQNSQSTWDSPPVQSSPDNSDGLGLKKSKNSAPNIAGKSIFGGRAIDSDDDLEEQDSVDEAL